MRQLRFRTLLRHIAGPALGLVLASVTSPAANAALTITSINETRASNVEGVGTANITVYGGVTGSLSRCASSPTDSTCDNCVTTSTGDAGLIACNNRRIHPDLRFQITIKSDSVETGVPRITTNADSSTTQATLVDTPTTVAKDTDVTITVTWSSLCNLISSANSGTNPFSSSGTCTLAANTDEARAILRVGIDDGGDGDVDDFKTITFIVRDGIEVDGSGVSLGKNCGGDASNDDITAVGICYFEVGSGDSKAFMKKISALNNFPTGTNIRFNWVRALYTKRTSANTPNHNAINASSTFEDLEVSGTDPGSLSLSPARITNSINNDEVYDFKVAVVDAARNVGYYTASAHDTDCDDAANSTSPNPPTGSGVAECHTARPSEVVGILSQQTNCFVATATYGSPMAKEVSTFRAFRDRFIVPTSWGKAFVRFYYEQGPKAARFISESETLRSISRAALWAPLQFAKFSLEYGGAAALALLFTIIAAPIAISRTVSRLIGRKMKRATHV